MKHTGFSLTELMIALAIIIILATTAIPAYQDYTIRTKVAEGLNLAASAKRGVASYFQSTGRWPIDNSQAGLGSGFEFRGDYTHSIWVGIDGSSVLIAISYSNPSEVAGKSIVLVGDADGASISWACTEGTVPERFRPSACRS